MEYYPNQFVEQIKHQATSSRSKQCERSRRASSTMPTNHATPTGDCPHAAVVHPSLNESRFNSHTTTTVTVPSLSARPNEFSAQQPNSAPLSRSLARNRNSLEGRPRVARPTSRPSLVKRRVGVGRPRPWAAQTSETTCPGTAVTVFESEMPLVKEEGIS